jgi:predicted RNase H-like HicB family nuclease
VYLVQGVSVPDAVTFGKTFAEAQKMARDVLELYRENTQAGQNISQRIHKTY